MPYTIEMNVEVPEHLLADLMITAFDGSYGACWHWATPSEEDWLQVGREHDEWISARVRDKYADDEIMVTHETLVDGMQALLRLSSRSNRTLKSLQDRIEEAVIDDDASMLDATDADTIVQYGAFGSEKYC